MASLMDAAAAESAMHAAMGMVMPGHELPWREELVALWTMWAVMMAAMMVPSATPVAMLVLGVFRRRGDRASSLSAGVFVAGYLLIWMLFSGAAAAAQIWLRRSAVLSPEMAATSKWLSAALLVVAGIYQWLP